MTIDYSKWQNLTDSEDETDETSQPLQVPSPEGSASSPSRTPLNTTTGEQALQQARQGGDKKTTSILSRLVSKEYIQEGNLTRARELIVDAVRLAQEVGEEDLKRECDTMLGQCSQLEGNLAQAEQHFLQALDFYTSKRDATSEAAQLVNLGQCNLQRNQNKKAAGYFQRALDSCKCLQPPHQVLLEVAREGLAESQKALQAQNFQNLEPPSQQLSFLERAHAAGWCSPADSGSHSTRVSGEEVKDAGPLTDSGRLGHSSASPSSLQTFNREGGSHLSGGSTGETRGTYEGQQEDVLAEAELREAELEAVDMVRSLRLQGRNTEADRLEALVNNSVSSESGSDIVDYDDLD